MIGILSVHVRDVIRREMTSLLFDVSAIVLSPIFSRPQSTLQYKKLWLKHLINVNRTSNKSIEDVHNQKHLDNQQNTWFWKSDLLDWNIYRKQYQRLGFFINWDILQLSDFGWSHWALQVRTLICWRRANELGCTQRKNYTSRKLKLYYRLDEKRNDVVRRDNI